MPQRLSTCLHQKILPSRKARLLKEGGKEECGKVCAKRNCLQWMVKATWIVHGKLCYLVASYQFMEKHARPRFLKLILSFIKIKVKINIDSL